MVQEKLKTRIKSHRTVRWVVRVVSDKGRPLAALALVAFCVLLLLSDWPVWWPKLPKVVTSVIDAVAGSSVSGRRLLFDRYQRQSPRKVESQPVTIVAIDEKSLAKLGQWPWPRHRLAALIDAIGTHRPAAVGLDIYMPEADQTSPKQVAAALRETQPDLAKRLSALPGNDELLANSLQQTRAVLGAAGFDFKTYTTSEGLRTWPLALQGSESLPPITRNYPAVLASLPLLQSAASGQAVLSVDTDDGIIRRIPLVVRVSDQPAPSLAIEMFRVALGAPQTQVQLDSHGVSSIKVGDLEVPTQPAGDVWVHFARSADTLQRYVSAIDVLENKANPEALSGKLVLIGLTGMGLNDMRITALGEHVPGIEIQAQLIESLFDQRFLLRPWWMIFAEMGFVLVVGGLMIWWLPRVQPTHRLGVIYRLPMPGVVGTVAMNALAVSAGFYLFRVHGLLFDAASFVLATSAVFGMIFTFVQASAAKAREELRNKQWEELVQRAEHAEAALEAQSEQQGEKT